MIHETSPEGLRFLRFKGIPSDRVNHGIFTRCGGTSPAPWNSLNFSITVGDSRQNTSRNNELAHRALGLDSSRAVDRYIAHTTIVRHVDERHLDCPSPPADGLLTRQSHLSLIMTFADCQPLLAYDPKRHTLAVVHAGWRGTLAGMALSLVRAMEAAGSCAADLYVGLGPAIGRCCYEVGPEVAMIAREWPDGDGWLHPGANGRPHLDLSAANETILRRAGVREIERADICTACRTDLFFSYRAERPVTGRFALIAALQ